MMKIKTEFSLRNSQERILIKVVVVLLLLLFCLALVPAQTKRGFQPRDLSALKDVSDAQLSPDGARVVYTVTEVSADHLRNVSHLWIVPTVGGEPKRLTSDEANESTARWSPDGKLIAFYSDRDKQNGLWVRPVEGGELQLVTHVARTNFFLTHAGESFTWSPDGKRLAFLSSPESLPKAAKVVSSGNNSGSGMAGIPERLRRPLTLEEINQLPAETREMILRAQGRLPGTAGSSASSPPAPIRAEASAQSSASSEVSNPSASDDPRVITRLQYKSRTAFSDNLQSHIFIADLTALKNGGQIQQLTDGRYYEHSINWSPKGDEIVFVSNHEPDPDKVNNTDLFIVNVTNGAVRQLTKTKGCEWTPVFSPDGGRIAYLATKREVTTIDSVAEDSHAWVISAQGDNAREVNSEQDRRANLLKWVGNDIVSFTAGEAGTTAIFIARIRGYSGIAGIFLDRELQATSFSLIRDDTWVYTASDEAHPAEIRIYSSLTDKTRFLTSHNEALQKALHYSKMREFELSNEGFKVQGWLIPPINLDEKKKYPVILIVHGGPHGMHGYSFNPTAQALAARGYAVLLINPRGSSGYGQKFADGCVNDWGGGDYRDLMRGVDEALARFPFLDKDRMGVMGGSYGGYLTNWIVTQTDRFKAAVASASLSNLISFYSTSLYQDLIHTEFNGSPWDNFDLLWERSPLKHIKQVKTPTMLIHGENDNDVHITQAEEMYTALKMRGIKTVLVRYPREGHGLREPQHREDSLNRTLEWFDRHLK